MGKGRKGKPSMSEIQTLSGNLSGKRSASLLFTHMPYSIMKGCSSVRAVKRLNRFD